MASFLKALLGGKKPEAAAPSQPAFDAGKRFEEGVALHQAGQLDEARAIYAALLEADPRHSGALHMLGLVAAETGDLPKAAALVSQAVALSPGNAGLHATLGSVLQDMGQTAAAEASYGKAVALAPDDVHSWFSRAMAQRALGQVDAAIASYGKVIGLQPGLVEAWFNRGNAHRERKQLQEAAGDYAQAISLASGYAHAWFNRATVLQELGQPQEALASYDGAISANPDYAEAHGNRGTLLQALGQLEASVGAFDVAIRLQPDNAEAHYNRGNSLRDLLQLDAALQSYDNATRLKPDHSGAWLNKGMALLLNGEMARGWEPYEWRWKKNEIAPDRRNFAQPRWDGKAPLAGKTVLLYGEQGLGDSIQFARYAPLVKALGARVVLEVHKPLLALLQGLNGVDELVQRDKPLPAFDLHCPLLSLPLALGTTLENIPARGAYLHSDPATLARWQDRLGAKSQPRIGLVWSGSTEHVNDHNRSLTLDALLPHLPAGCDYVCLQREMRAADRPALETSAIRFFGEEIKDFADTAALCGLMDVVISVDTSVAHLAGALGRPTWVLLPYIPDWRWLLERSDSPWYESVRLYRQGADRQWGPVLERFAADLKQLAA